MVNTFVLYSPNHELPGYAKSALSLDFVRLKKQCLEAHQIHNIIVDLHLVASLLSIQFPTVTLPDLSPYTQWIKDVSKQYSEQSFRLMRQDDEVFKISKDDADKYFVINSKYILNKTYRPIYQTVGNFTTLEQYSIDFSIADYRKYFKSDPYPGLMNTNIRAKRVTMNLPKAQVLLTSRNDRIITLGWCNHPAVKMWLGYGDSLKCYINDHLHAYRQRTDKSMNLPGYIIPPSDKIVHPWWLTHTDKVIMSHRAVLLRKEIFRKEKPHYIILDVCRECSNEYRRLGYVWVTSIPPSGVTSLLKNEFNMECFADITNDKIDITTDSPAFKAALASALANI